MADQKNRRSALSVQDVINGQPNKPRARFKSGYSGPKRAPAQTSRPVQGYSAPARTASAPAASFHRSGGILDYAWVAYSGVLAIALATAIIAFLVSGNDRGGIYYPHDIPTITGVVKNIFDDYRSGGLGSNYNTQGASVANTVQTPEGNATDAADSGENPDNAALLGEEATSAAPNSTTGATMALDVGSTYGTYNSATSHEELLTQLDQALAAGDTGFVGMKLCYEDEESKSLIGYPESVVDHFTKYMADNSDKRANFLAEIKDEAQFSAKNGSAYLVKLPLLQFTINMGYDGTTISISGFADQKMDSGQSAIVSPLLPCMYTIHAQTAKGEQTSEIECNMNEGNLKINIGVTQ